MRSLAEAGVAAAGRRIAIIGAGGAATAVAIQAAIDGVAAITFCNRRDGFFADAARTVALLGDRFGCDAGLCDLDDATALRDAIAASDILINATPVGMAASRDSLPVPEARLRPVLRPGLVVSDLIYVPAETRLLKLAQAAGCTTVSGLGMQLYQGVRAFRIWTGQQMPVDAARILAGFTELGRMQLYGFLAIWCDIGAEDLADYRAWLMREHIADRTFSPGFLRRAAVHRAGRPKPRTSFSTPPPSPAVLQAPAYRAILDTPSPWTRRIMPRFGRFDRAAGRRC